MKRSREPDDVQHQQFPSAVSVDTSDGDGTDSGPATPHARDGGPPPRTKIVNLDPSQSDAGNAPRVAMTCQLHRDKIPFPSYDAYETHYNREHLNRCLECRRNFPSPFYLSLHTDEWHDPFVAVKRDKGEHTYACFVEGCERKCGSSDKRRRHLIDKHSFPKNFFFNITQYGIDGRQSLLLDSSRRQHQRRPSLVLSAKKDVHNRAVSITKSPAQMPSKAEGSKQASKEVAPAQRDNDAMMEEEEEDDDDDDDDDDADGDASDSDEEDDEADKEEAPATRRPNQTKCPDVEMDDLAGAMSAMTFVPRSVRFGRGRGKAGFARR